MPAVGASEEEGSKGRERKVHWWQGRRTFKSGRTKNSRSQHPPPLAGATLGHEWLRTKPEQALLPGTEAMQTLPSEVPRAMGQRHRRRARLLPRTPDALEPLIPLVMDQPQSDTGVCFVTTLVGVSCLRRMKQYFLHFLFFICLATDLNP